MAKNNTHIITEIEESYRNLFETTLDGMLIVNNDGVYVDVNASFCRFLKISREQIIGAHFERFVSPEDLEKVRVLLAELRENKNFTAEFPLIAADENRVELQWSSRANFVPGLHVCITRDVTANKMAENALRESEFRYRSLLENANDIIYSHDLNGVYLSLNRAGERITGYSRDEVVGKMNITEVVCPEYLKLARQAMATKLDSSSPTIYEVEILAKDKRRLTLEVSTRISYRNGEPFAVEGIARDVTTRRRTELERKRLAEQIEQQKKRLHSLVSSVPSVVWEEWREPNEIQQFSFVSEYAETLVGYSVEEWLATPNFWLTIVHPEDRRKAAETAAQTFAEGRSGVNRFRWITKNGRTIWVESQSVVIRDEAGNPVGMRGVAFDITAQHDKELVEQFLLEASAMLASSLDYSKTLDAVAKLAVPRFAEWCAIDIASEDNTKLQRLCSAHADPEMFRRMRELYERYPPDAGETSGIYQVLQTGVAEFYPQISADFLEETARDKKHFELLQKLNLGSAMIVPLKARGRVCGVMTFINSASGKIFTGEDLALAEDLANRAALAIENTRLFRIEQKTRAAAERTSNFLTRLQNVSFALAAAVTPQEVTFTVIEQAAKSLGAHAGVIVKLTASGDELEIVSSIGFPEKVTREWKKFSLAEKVPIAEAVRFGKPILIESSEKHAAEYPALGLLASVTNTNSMAALPMIVKEQVIGAMGFSFLQPQNFAEDVRAFMKAVAYQCAQAFERAQLYENERALRQQAENASRMKDEFLATVSHELRTPLNAIVGWAKILSSEAADPEMNARAVEIIERNAHAQSQIIEDILDVSRIITGKLNLNASEIELNALVAAALESVKPTARTKEIEFTADFSPDSLRVWADADRLQQVLWNLFSNAVKFTPIGGKVEVIVRKTNDSAEIAVRDNGQGIEPEFLPSIFDRFSQADASSARQFGGLGLGLAIVRHLVEMHGGTVKAESAGSGSGATLSFTMPLLAAAAPPESLNEAEKKDKILASPPFAVLPGTSLLIVEDDQDSRDLLLTILQKAGADVTAVASSGEAVEALKNFQPQVIISDIGMPGDDGYSLMRRIRENERGDGSQIPAIALTAYARDEDRQKTAASGFQKHIAKPFDPAELIAAVKDLAKIE